MVNWIAIGVIAVVLVLLVLVALDRWGVFADDRENPDSGTDRIKQEARREGDFSVSWLKKHRTLTLPAKVVSVSIGLLVLSTGVYVWLTLKSGAPVEVPYANGLAGAGIGIAGVAGGIALANNRTRGRLDVIYEDQDSSEETTETVWFDPDEIATDTNGREIVYEHFSTRILGLFGRRKLVAHDRELRTERGVLSDLVAHRIPDHAVRMSESHYVIRTQGRRTTEGVSNAADYDYRAPIELPYQSYLQQRERTQKMQMRLETMDAKLGEAQAQLRDLRRRLSTNETRTFEDAKEEITEILELLPARNANVKIREERSKERLPKSQRNGVGDTDETEVRS